MSRIGIVGTGYVGLTTGAYLAHLGHRVVCADVVPDKVEGLSRGELCWVVTGRQMGKSSLMVRTAGRLREAGSTVVITDLTAIGQISSTEGCPLVSSRTPQISARWEVFFNFLSVRSF